jgi:hypothetical protein
MPQHPTRPGKVHDGTEVQVNASRLSAAHTTAAVWPCKGKAKQRSVAASVTGMQHAYGPPEEEPPEEEPDEEPEDEPDDDPDEEPPDESPGDGAPPSFAPGEELDEQADGMATSAERVPGTRKERHTRLHASLFMAPHVAGDLDRPTLRET